MTDRTVSRRNLLKTTGIVGVGALILGGGVLGLRSCQREGGEEIGEDLIPLSDEPGPYAVWREMQTFLRASPDHSLGRAKALIEAGDVAAMHLFVRDELRLVSAAGKHHTLGETVRWGPRAALRAGAGTAREKAEILAGMIRQSGRKADVVEAPPATREEITQLFYRDVEQAFEPPITPRILENWRKRLGARPEEAVTSNIQQHEDKVIRTRDQLREKLDERGLPLSWKSYDDRSFGNVPIVRFEEADGRVLYADPIRPDAEITEEGGKVSEAKAPTGMLPVSVSLSFTTTQDPKTPVEIAHAEWNAEDVCGRQVRIGFKPLQDMEEMLAVRLGDLRTYTPFLSIQALDGGEIDPERQVVMGTTFTLSGDTLKAEDDGSVSLNGTSIRDGTPSGRAGFVHSVEVETDASRYPDMRLLVRPRGADGKIVDGLNGADFSVTDQGVQMPHLIRVQNRAPSILFLSDSSMSMPLEYRGANGEAMQALVGRVQEAAREIHPEATVILKTTNSNLWEHVMRTLGTNVDLIVYATDGHLEGWKPTPEERAPLAMGPKIITMNVRGNTDYWRQRFRTNAFDEIAEAANGVALDVVDGDAAQIEEAIRTFLDEGAPELPYVLSYYVPGESGGLRTAAVTVGEPTGTAEYDSGAQTAPQRVMGSLQMTVTVGKRKVTRVIGGHDGAGAASQADIDHLRGAVLGTHLLSFEGPPPSLSTVLDDVLTARLSMERIDRALAETDSLTDLLSRVEEGYHILPGELATLMMRTGALSGETFNFAEQGMRCVLYSSHPVMNTDQVISRVDILPTAMTYVLSPELDDRLGLSLEAGLRLAAAEATLYPEKNTYRELEGKALSFFSEDLYKSNKLSREERDQWGHSRRPLRTIFPYPGAVSICAEDLSTQASWVIDNETMEVHALLPDLSGGGAKVARIEQQLLEVDRAMSALNMLAFAAGAVGVLNPIGGVALAIVAAYGQTLARITAAATVSIILMDASGIEPQVRRALAMLACNVVKSIFLGVFGAAGRVAGRAVEIFTAADNVIGITGANNPFSCPG